MKKLLVLFLTLSLLVCTFGLIDCNGGDHIHIYSSEWSFDKTHHWQNAACGCDNKLEYGEHVYEDSLCTVCNANSVHLLFDGGEGTEANPYIISTVEEFANIAEVPTFAYFKVKDGVEQLDLSNWSSIRLNGCLDGNNVKLVNLNTRLFTHVGNNEEQQIYVKNLEVTINFVSSSHAALIKEIDNFGTTVFENVSIHGYIEGESNTAVLFSFGTQNGHETGSNYTVELKNVKTDVTLVCAGPQPFAGFVAHAYAGTGNKLTLNIDAQTEFTGEVYSAEVRTFNEYVAIGAYEINVEGQPYTQLTKQTVKLINKVLPVKGENGYTLAIGENVSKVVVAVTGQLTAYDENGEKIATKSGITMTFKTESITEGLEGNLNILGLFDSLEIVNGAEAYNAELVDGVLKVYIPQNASYETGWVKLQVQQYNANGEIVSCGTLEIWRKD